MWLTILAPIFVFGILVLIHELGHFLMAKYTGMRVDEFAIGFGPRIFSKQYGETVYSLRCVPLGGFNDIAGMDPEESAEVGPRGYCNKPVWARMLVILAGPVMNFILPVFIFFAIYFLAGASVPSQEPVLGDVIAGRAAAEAGLQKGDRVVEINGVVINSWDDFVVNVRDKDGQILHVTYQREGEVRTATMIPVYDKEAKRSMVGVVSSVETINLGLLESATMAVKKTGMVVIHMVKGIGELASGQHTNDVVGPLGVAQMAGEVAHVGFAALMNFAALLSLNLGVVNLLPIPALDGGHFITLVLEALRGKPLGSKALYYTQIAGISLLVMLMLFATKNDVMRFLAG